MTLSAVMFSLVVVPGMALAGGPAAPDMEPAPVAPAPEARPSQDWTGFYLGGQIGQTNSDFIGGSGATISDGNTETYGLHAGFNHDFGSWVLGGGTGP